VPFSANVGVTSLYVEICVVIYVIEVANAIGWINLWLECDFILVVLAFC